MKTTNATSLLERVIKHTPRPRNNERLAELLDEIGDFLDRQSEEKPFRDPTLAQAVKAAKRRDRRERRRLPRCAQGGR